MPTHMTAKDLQRELADLQDRYPKLSDDDTFLLWFLRAFVCDDEPTAAAALCGGAGDKAIDAVLIDDATKTAFIVQGKYRRGIGEASEKRMDVLGFAQLAEAICGDTKAFRDYCKGLRPEVEQRLLDVRHRVTKGGCQLQLFYATTGRASPALVEEAKRTARRSDYRASFQLFNGDQILLLLSDYLDGVAPPVPSLDLEIEVGKGAGASGVLQRYDHRTDIESWVFSMTERSVAEMYKQAGIRLFARNVRGFLGNTQINRGMETTLEREPDYFWYYNNGITIICDDAERKSRSGSDILQVTNPQVINGQQTTRTLARMSGRSSSAGVLVRVIRVPRNGGDSNEQFETLVSKIVAATNWQNAIRASDLMCNDRRQIEVERQLRKLGYLYMRKRQTRSEAKRFAGAHAHFLIKKEEIAQATAACDLDPAVVREGKEGLFEERLYDRVFPTADPLYYLSRYWLMRQVSYCARGYPERAYAKWLVLNFVWSRVAVSLRGRSSQDAFRRACEREKQYWRVIVPLSYAVDAVFRVVLAFYRAKRGKGETATDVSTFFKRKGLAAEFARYWKTTRTGRKTQFTKKLAAFETALGAV